MRRVEPLRWEWTSETDFREWHAEIVGSPKLAFLPIDLLGKELAPVFLSDRFRRVVARWCAVEDLGRGYDNEWYQSFRRALRRSLVVVHDRVDREAGVLADVICFQVPECGFLVNVLVPYVATGGQIAVGTMLELPIDREFWADHLLLRIELEHLEV